MEGRVANIDDGSWMLPFGSSVNSNKSSFQLAADIELGDGVDSQTTLHLAGFTPHINH